MNGMIELMILKCVCDILFEYFEDQGMKIFELDYDYYFDIFVEWCYKFEGVDVSEDVVLRQFFDDVEDIWLL